MQAATLPLDGNPIRADAGPNILKIFLTIIAVVETLNAVLQLSTTLFGETSPGGTDVALAAIGSLVAIASLVFAVKGRLRHAIVAVAAIGLMDWLIDLPSNAHLVLHDSASLKSLSVLFHIFVLPAFCIAGIALAIRNVRLGMAAVLAAMPLLVDILLIVILGIGLVFQGS